MHPQALSQARRGAGAAGGINSGNPSGNKKCADVYISVRLHTENIFCLHVFVQTIVVFIPALADIFQLVQLTQEQWLITIGISLLPIPLMEIQKKIHEIRFGKVVYIKEKTAI